MVPLTTLNEQLLPERRAYSLIAEPSVSWTGQRLPLSTGVRQRVTPGQMCRDSYVNIYNRVNIGTQSLCVVSSDQGAVASSHMNPGVLASQIPPLPSSLERWIMERETQKVSLTGNKDLRW